MFQILDCATDIKSCCNDYELANLLYAIKNGLKIVQIIVPIVLIIAGIVGVVGMMTNPNDPKKLKAVIARFTSAIIIFFIPFLVNLVLNMTSNSYATINVATCWADAEALNKELSAQATATISTTKSTNKPLNEDTSKYQVNTIQTFTDFDHLSMYNQTGTYANDAVCSRYPDASNCGHACGLSAFMAAHYVLTGKDIDYKSFTEESCSTGLFNGGGSEWSKVTANDYYASHYNIKSNTISKSYATIVQELSAGHVVTALIQQGYQNIGEGGFNYSPNAHFIDLMGYDAANDKIYVYNPTGIHTGWQSRAIIERYVVSVALALYSDAKA
jgi:hypothetical protein